MALRYYCPDLGTSDRTRLGSDVAHHLREVLRAQVGDSIELFDGVGRWAKATVVTVDRSAVDVAIEERHDEAPSGLRQVEIALSIPRGKRFDQVLEHGCELGVGIISPIVFERSPPHAKSDRRDRWRRTCIAACGQCGRCTLPQLGAPQSLDEWLAQLEDSNCERWVAQPGGTWQASNEPTQAPALLVVGPEGGFVDHEVDALRQAGFQSLGIGPHVLRIETAALAGLSLLLHAGPRSS